MAMCSMGAKMVIKYRHNVMDVNSVTAFARIKGGYNSGCRDVYFIRLLGGSSSLKDEVLDADRMLSEAMQTNRLLYKRIMQLPLNLKDEERNYYLQCYDRWAAGNKEKMVIHCTEGNEEFADILSRAMAAICDEYAKYKKGISDSIQKNFAVKLIYWTDYIFEHWHNRWNEHTCIKIIAENVSKVQEYLFYYLLTLIGADVLMIQNKADIDICDNLKGLSRAVTLGDFVDWRLPAFVSHVNQEHKENTKPPIDIESVNNKKEKSEKIVIHIPEHRRKTNQANQRTVSSSMPMQSTTTIVSSVKGRKEKSFEELALLASSIVMIEVHNRSGEVMGIGSGIMIGKKGYILTNHHVVHDGWYYSVRIENDDKTYQTNEVIKYNSVQDLAVIRIDRALSPLPVYNGRDKLVRGQKVVAIGSPLGLFNSVSDGIISGFRKMDKVDVIQFTAPTSPGSSGGAVLNMFGEVIGISSAGMDRGQNLNLAVPYDCINLFIQGFVS